MAKGGDPYRTRVIDGETGEIRRFFSWLDHPLMESVAWRNLSAKAHEVFIAWEAKYYRVCEGDWRREPETGVPFGVADCARLGIRVSRNTLARVMRELQREGFVTRESVSHGQKRRFRASRKWRKSPKVKCTRFEHQNAQHLSTRPSLRISLRQGSNGRDYSSERGPDPGSPLERGAGGSKKEDPDPGVRDPGDRFTELVTGVDSPAGVALIGLHVLGALRPDAASELTGVLEAVGPVATTKAIVAGCLDDPAVRAGRVRLADAVRAAASGAGVSS